MFWLLFFLFYNPSIKYREGFFTAVVKAVKHASLGYYTILVHQGYYTGNYTQTSGNVVPVIAVAFLSNISSLDFFMTPFGPCQYVICMRTGIKLL